MPVASEPFAYLVTWTCYGSRLHGDERGSVDRDHNIPGTLMLAYNAGLREWERSQMKGKPFLIDPGSRFVIVHAISETCTFRGWALLAQNVRTNHVHVVLAARDDPSRVLHDLKARSTRRLHETHLLGTAERAWSRGGSTRGLFTSQSVEAGIDYALNRQGRALPTQAPPGWSIEPRV